jgi:hypothetical protein
MGDYTEELIVHGRHDPAHVETALARWRELRASGRSPGIRGLDSLLERTERDAARMAGSADGGTAEWAVCCERCGDFHSPADPCPRRRFAP